jgi:DNA repair protein RadC
MDEGPVYSSAVREMPQEDRPRERLARLGAEALRDAELIAVLFRTGTREYGAVALAERVVRHFGDLDWDRSRPSRSRRRSNSGCGWPRTRTAIA